MDRSFDWALSSSCCANQPRLRSGGLQQAEVIGVNRAVLGLGAYDLMLGTGNLVFATAKLGYGTFQLSVQLWNFQNRKSLAGLYPIADIYIDVLDVARYLGMNVYNLVRLELPGKFQGMRNRAACYRDYCCGGNLCDSRC